MGHTLGMTEAEIQVLVARKLRDLGISSKIVVVGHSAGAFAALKALRKQLLEDIPIVGLVS